MASSPTTDRSITDPSSPRPPHVGIIGGGQLGAMLCDAARNLGVRTTIMSPDPDCPAAAHADDVLVGSFDEVSDATRLVGHVDCITFEIEAVSAPVLKYLAGEAIRGSVRVEPSPMVLLKLQNKALQKKWLLQYGLPGPLFQALEPSQLDGPRLAARFGLPFVQKTQVGGYDGRGVQIIRQPADYDRLWPVPSVIETYLPEIQELAVLVARGARGESVCYDPVSLKFNPAGNVLDEVIAPATVDPAVARRARSIATAAVNRLATRGVFAVEFFLLPDQSLLINEISPRVHNAGHHTLDAAMTSQFEQHIRAILGMPLGMTTLVSPSVMKNLLHDPAAPVAESALQTLPPEEDLHVHWYDKAQTHPLRKLGHITCLDSNIERAEQKAAFALRALQRLSAEQH